MKSRRGEGGNLRKQREEEKKIRKCGIGEAL